MFNGSRTKNTWLVAERFLILTLPFTHTHTHRHTRYPLHAGCEILNTALRAQSRTPAGAFRTGCLWRGVWEVEVRSAAKLFRDSVFVCVSLSVPLVRLPTNIHSCPSFLDKRAIVMIYIVYCKSCWSTTCTLCILAGRSSFI